MSLQQTITKLVMKLPGGLLVKMAGGKPLTIRGRTLEPQLQLMAWNGRNAPALSSLPAETVQAVTKETLASVAAPIEPGVRTEDLTIPGPNQNQIPARIYRPDGQDPKAPLMVYYHMGGGVIGDLETCHAWCSILASRVKCPVLSVDYRLAPQHKFPAGIDDCCAAYEWGMRNAAKFGAPEGVAAVGGDSMGGNFSAIIAQEMQREDKPLPAMQLLIYPAIDLVEEFPSRKEFSETFSLVHRHDGLVHGGIPAGRVRQVGPDAVARPDGASGWPAAGGRHHGGARSAVRRGRRLCPPPEGCRRAGDAQMLRHIWRTPSRPSR
jgi:acetyl esterase